MAGTGSLRAEDEHRGSTMMTFKRCTAASHSARPEKASDRTRTSPSGESGMEIEIENIPKMLIKMSFAYTF